MVHIPTTASTIKIEATGVQPRLMNLINLLREIGVFVHLDAKVCIIENEKFLKFESQELKRQKIEKKKITYHIFPLFPFSERM